MELRRLGIISDGRWLKADAMGLMTSLRESIQSKKGRKTSNLVVVGVFKVFFIYSIAGTS